MAASLGGSRIQVVSQFLAVAARLSRYRDIEVGSHFLQAWMLVCATCHESGRLISVCARPDRTLWGTRFTDCLPAKSISGEI